MGTLVIGNHGDFQMWIVLNYEIGKVNGSLADWFAFDRIAKIFRRHAVTGRRHGLMTVQ